ncbi:MAG TPA: carbohydrate ABC transporter permease [Clostridiales bacterium]|nr:carbohydrate ABC transporter permease [Clostridiales bacterium]
MKTKEFITTQIISNTILLILSLLALFPFLLLIIGSFTDNAAAVANGYTYFPEKWSLGAYEYILTQADYILKAYLNTFFVTIAGTLVSLLITSMFGYVLSVSELPGRRLLMFMCIFTMLFNGGIVSTYFVYSNVIHIKNTIFALIVPGLLMNAFTVMLFRNYYVSSVSTALQEAARLDGAGEFFIYFKVVVPLSKPIIATIALMSGLGYWNDWTNGLYYLTDRGGSHLYTIQIIMNKMNENIAFLANNASKLTGVSVADLPSTTIRMAIAVIGILPILVAYPFFQKYFVKGISIGAVKG